MCPRHDCPPSLLLCLSLQFHSWLLLYLRIKLNHTVQNRQLSDNHVALCRCIASSSKHYHICLL